MCSSGVLLTCHQIIVFWVRKDFHSHLVQPCLPNAVREQSPQQFCQAVGQSRPCWIPPGPGSSPPDHMAGATWEQLTRIHFLPVRIFCHPRGLTGHAWTLRSHRALPRPRRPTEYLHPASPPHPSSSLLTEVEFAHHKTAL